MRAANTINLKQRYQLHGPVIMGIEISWNDIRIISRSNSRFIIVYLISHI